MAKSPREWTEADLRALIAEKTKESLELDYKECAALDKTDGKKNDISEDVSAFANSAGGVLVYAIVEKGHIPLKLDDGYEPTAISREWLEDVINSRIHPRIDGVAINQVELTTHAPGKVAYVVYVPPSSTAHMASDHKYYRRFNFQNRPMEDYEVRERMFKLTHPEVGLYRIRMEDAGGCARSYRCADAVVQIQNVGKVFAEYYAVEVRVPSRFRDRAWSVSPTRVSRKGGADMYVFQGQGPIFPGQVHDFPAIRLKMKAADLGFLAGAAIDLTIYAGSAPRREVRTKLAEVPAIKKILEEMRRW